MRCRKMTEEEFQEMIVGVDLNKKEINVLREDCNLSVDDAPTEINPTLRKRIQCRAWAKLNPGTI